VTATVCLFAKAPRPGHAKSRLAPVFGREGAALLARALLLDALDSWTYSPVLVAQTGAMPPALSSRFQSQECIDQGDGDLGQRMERVLRHALVSSDVAMVVGTDIPCLGDADAAQALAKLQSHDAVMGPACDGGFYLLALKRCPEGLLHDLPWSQRDTAKVTVERLKSAGMSVAFLDQKFDVDEAKDLGPLSQALRMDPSAMSHTRGFLASSSNRAISVVIPVLNEAQRLPSLLRDLRTIPGLAQIIVADGGSADDSVKIAESVPGVEVIVASRGRGAQMNAGASIAMGGTLLFLHADAQLPTDVCEQINRSLQGKETVAGAFRLQTQYDECGPQRRWVAPFLRLADLRSKYSGLPYGDQALFVRTSTFRSIGGYPELPLFEDLAMSMALREVRPLHIAEGPVRVSGRRFQQRPLYYLALMNTFPLLFRMGVPARRLARFYR